MEFYDEKLNAEAKRTVLRMLEPEYPANIIAVQRSRFEWRITWSPLRCHGCGFPRPPGVGAKYVCAVCKTWDDTMFRATLDVGDIDVVARSITREHPRELTALVWTWTKVGDAIQAGLAHPPKSDTE